MSMVPANDRRPLRLNDRVTIEPDSAHPWQGHSGTTIRPERYGPKGIFFGWLVALDNGQEVYVVPNLLKLEG